MTISEVITDFKILYDEKVASDAAGLEDEEIRAYLDDAQNELIESKVFGSSQSGAGFEANQKRVSELRNLLEYSSLTASTGSNLNGFNYYVELPTGDTGFLYYIDSQSNLSRTKYPTITGADFRNVFVGYSNIGNFSDFGFKVHFLEPRVGISDGRLYLKEDSYTTLNTVDLEYIRKPASIRDGSTVNNVDFSDQLRGELVTIAVTKAIGAMSDQNRYQISSAEQQKESD